MSDERLYAQLDRIEANQTEIKVKHAELKGSLKALSDKLDAHIDSPARPECVEMHAAIKTHLDREDAQERWDLARKAIDYAQKAAIGAALYLGVTQ